MDHHLLAMGFWMKAPFWIIALLGLWEAGDLALPFIIGFGHVRAFVWNHILVGIILLTVGALAGMTSDIGTIKKSSWIATAAGLWLVIAPFILGAPEIAAGLWNDIAVGVIVILLSSASRLLLQRRE